MGSPTRACDFRGFQWIMNLVVSFSLDTVIAHGIKSEIQLKIAIDLPN